jgi:hypothetical protein
VTKTPKRPRDLNQWAKSIVNLATMDEHERAETQAAQEHREALKAPEDAACC